jgi:hypothetical protein
MLYWSFRKRAVFKWFCFISAILAYSHQSQLSSWQQAFWFFIFLGFLTLWLHAMSQTAIADWIAKHRGNSKSYGLVLKGDKVIRIENPDEV